jgi:hypothetical protein
VRPVKPFADLTGACFVATFAFLLVDMFLLLSFPLPPRGEGKVFVGLCCALFAAAATLHFKLLQLLFYRSGKGEGVGRLALR